MSRETTSDTFDIHIVKPKSATTTEPKARTIVVWEKKQSWKYKECFFPVGVWYTEVIPCSSHNPHNLLQEQQQNNWVDCKFLSGLQIWKDEEQGEKPPLLHSQEQSHHKENTVKWTNLQDSSF